MFNTKKNMIMKHLLLTILLSAYCVIGFAQIQKPSSDMNYRKKITMADDFFAKGDFGSAAVFYQSAFEEKPKKTGIAFKAGESFMKVRDYTKAAEMYKVVQEETKDYPKAKFKYALGLKQSGNYKEALTVFESFINAYRGEDFNEMNDRVANEVNGCEMAIQFINKGGEADIELEHLSRMVNSDEKEFAPIPFVENLLYFSSMRDGTSQIFRSERGGNGWDRPEKPQIFGSMEKPHFGHGTFTPDRRAFYFTQCEMNSAGEFTCDIYLMQRKNNKWIKPVRLPDYINEDNTTTTMPFVTVIDNKEILYYVSDKEGGMGGLDIWYVMKDEGSEDFNFSLPINAGVGVNTPNDETTPFYDKTAEVMYFSSNGHPGFGGLDVFRSNGHLSEWDKPVNLGLPTNSGADDNYYILGASKDYGYLISNRLEGTTKEFTDNDDIFYFGVKEIEVVLKGSITQSGKTNKLLDNVTVELIEINGTGSENSLITKIFNDGEYYFKLSPNKKYKVEASKDGYETTYFELETTAFKANSEFPQDLALEIIEVVAAIEEQPVQPVQPPGGAGRVETTTNNGGGAIQPPGGNRTNPDGNAIGNAETAVADVETTSGSEGEDNGGDTKVTDVEIDPTPPVIDPIEPIKEDGVVYNEDGDKTINFEELTDVEKRDRLFFVDSKPYIRRNGELYAVVGLVDDGSEIVKLNISTPEEKPNKPEVKVEESFGENVNTETGTYYKIQLVAVSTYKAYKYEDIKHLGAIQLESTVNDNGTTIERVMLTPFQTLDEAKETLSRIVDNPRFERAYIVKYVDGTRVKHSKIRLASFRG